FHTYFSLIFGNLFSGTTRPVRSNTLQKVEKFQDSKLKARLPAIQRFTRMNSRTNRSRTPPSAGFMLTNTKHADGGVRAPFLNSPGFTGYQRIYFLTPGLPWQSRRAGFQEEKAC